MSHIVTVKTQIRSRAAIAAACQRLGLEAPVQGKATIYGTAYEGTIVKPKDWVYPVCINTDTGEMHYDNYGGSWGADAELDRFKQAYAVAAAAALARSKGMACTEQVQDNGSIKLTIMEDWS